MDGNIYVVVETGQPTDSVEIGLGDNPEEALESLESTPIQSTGRDCGLSSALSWAKAQGWVTGNLDEIDDLTEDCDDDCDDYDDECQLFNSEEDYA